MSEDQIEAPEPTTLPDWLVFMVGRLTIENAALVQDVAVLRQRMATVSPASEREVSP